MSTQPGLEPTTPDEPWYRLDPAKAVTALAVRPEDGLTTDEAARRLERHGPNRLPEPPKRPAWLRFVDQFRDFLVGILAVAALVSAAVGDFKDPIVIGFVLLFNAVLGYVQENKADAALDALKRMLELRVRVRRGGEVVEVPSDELVPGDIVLLEAGDRLPADGRFLVAVQTSVDESALTGESVPVDKDTAAIDRDGDVPIGDRLNLGYMNTVLVRGRAELVVTGTGADTEIGRLAGMLSAAEERATPLQEQLEKLGKRLAAVAGVAVLAVFTVAMISGETLADALLEAVALAVAAIPEGLPAVVTVTLAVGVHRMAKRNAIVKKLASVETLGSTTVICSDKTGTLTLNQMTATDAWVGGERFRFTGLGYGTEGAGTAVDGGALDDPAAARLTAALVPGVLCNDAHLATGEDGRPGLVGDPTEGAFVVALAKLGVDGEDLRRRHERLDEVPFDSAVKFMATLHPHPDGDGLLLAVKGAPDVLLARCTALRGPGGVVPLGDPERRVVAEANDALAGEGLRVLAVASRRLDARPADAAVAVEELTLELLMGILDPPRTEAREAIAECHRAGIDFKMITGDHATTAGAIAAQLGIEGEVVTGADLDRMSDTELAERIEGIGVCARVSPEHKVRVVRALQSRGHVAAMTGDGVNDAAALKLADIGVAMGITGTEVTKEAADMVLADDNVATIVGAVERGRAIYENIVTFVRFQLATNVGAIMTFLVFRLSGLPAPFNPIQVLFVNIIADGPPAMSLGVDPPRPGVMDRAPRDRNEKILTGDRISRIVVQAVVMMVGTLVVYLAARDRTGDELVARTMAFTTFVFFQMVNALCVRSGNRSVFSRHTFTNGKLWTAIAVVYVMQFLIVQLPWLEGIFETTALDAGEWLVCLLVPLSLLVVEETGKAITRRVRPDAVA